MVGKVAFQCARVNHPSPLRSKARWNVACHAIPSAGVPNAFLTVDDENSFFKALNQECESGRIPKQLLPLWTDFFGNYKNALLSSDLPDHDIKLVAEVQATIADTVINQLANPYIFPSYHKGITEPYNYFEFGQRYVGSLIDFNSSYIGHLERFDRIQQEINAGDNVIILANHQSEADPGIWAHMLMHTHPDLAKNVIYVAGDRVISDPLCVPFSMGRNLFCVHSKRRMDDNPDTKAEKAALNRQTLRNMGEAIAKGGCLLWIAPAGGRDRPDDDGVYVPAKFDPDSVELMRALSSKAKKKVGRVSHLYPLAMFSAPLMPAPKTIDKALGERRIVNFTGVGISIGEELNVEAITAGIEGRDAIAMTVSNAVYERVCKLYIELDAVVKDPASAPAIFTQPWKQEAKKAAGAASGAASEGAPDAPSFTQWWKAQVDSWLSSASK
jgi:glycerol-3-phosphate O-acyltransferase